MPGIPPRIERPYAVARAEPVELSADRVDEFLAFAGRAGSGDRERVREMISAGREDRGLVDRLFERFERDRKADFGLAVVTLSVIGELRRADALPRLERLVWEELPETDHVGHGALGRRDIVEMFQSKAAEAIAYLATVDADAVTLRVIGNHASTAVRSAAVDAYLFNHHDSDEARATVRGVLRPGDVAFLDRVRHARAMDVDSFNAGLTHFYSAHPEEVAPQPGRPPRRDDRPKPPPDRRSR